MPGATPQSMTTTTPLALANASNSNGSSAKKEMSTAFFLFCEMKSEWAIENAIGNQGSSSFQTLINPRDMNCVVHALGPVIVVQVCNS